MADFLKNVGTTAIGIIMTVIPVQSSQAPGVVAAGFGATTTVVKDVLDVWIDRLAVFECPDCPPNYKRIDDNGRYSYDCLQFQEATFVSEVKRFKMLPDAENSEIMNMINDCSFQKELARKMILADGPETAYWHWHTSVAHRGLDLPPKIK